MSIGGSGPVNARADHSTFMGRATDEAFADYGISVAPPSKKDVALFNPHDRASMIHGDETVGLGSSTFLEGTPAAKAAVEKAQQESAQSQDGGLQRKKSLAQRIRGINRPPREGFGASGRMTNPEGVYYRDRPSGGSVSSPRGGGENNPFFAEYEPGKDGEEEISVKKMNSNSPTSPPPPGGLERRATTDALSDQPKQKTGLLGRMKSLKGGPRSRPADRDFGNAE
ncbi:hypothetical protein M406DRAFT_355049 [Cryphonectria parasitica EP155]|uniref:Pal1 cell morphology protein n=1 Tax=Cryphonectria parasitica (strain ATCC 38755 / EP155) TaxID=660469 RepID=A0A9P4YA48_CRYP1|nr:uncharacterized protein M406DRAFT_355049 [Cryphonectria parasitica EP155]KAF3768840.1 hypothetical protein M406DRAFT_355049 [Cryphonectria parasitica EP155]